LKQINYSATRYPKACMKLKKLMIRLRPVCVALMVLCLFNATPAASSWHELAKGLEYRDISTGYFTPWSHIHVFRIDLHYQQLALIMAKDLSVPYASVEEYAKHSQALVTVNGGFFDEGYQPLGLRINNSQQKSPLKRISWWGVFFVKKGRAYLSSVSQFSRDKHIEFALQSGPRLIVNSKIPPLKPGRAERSALGIDKDGHVIMLITDGAPLSTTELAQIMKSAPLSCLNALNLDGGSSSQLHAKVNRFQLNVHGFSNVSDAIIVKSLKP